MSNHFEYTGRDLAVITAARIWEALSLNEFHAYHCDPVDDITTLPFSNTVWEEREMFICSLNGLWMNTAWVLHPNGGYSRVFIKDGKVFVSQDVTHNGDFYKIFSV